MEPEKLKMLGAALCLCGCIMGPAIGWLVCGYTVDKDGFRPKNWTCAIITGAVFNCICCIGLSLLLGIIKF